MTWGRFSGHTTESITRLNDGAIRKQYSKQGKDGKQEEVTLTVGAKGEQRRETVIVTAAVDAARAPSSSVPTAVLYPP